MTEHKPSDAEKAKDKANAPTTAGHHPEQPSSPVSSKTHPNQPMPADEPEDKSSVPRRASAAKGAKGGAGPKEEDPIVGECQALREEVEEFTKDRGKFDELREKHADLLARAQDTLSRSDFAAATGILDVVAGLLNQLAPRT